MKSPSNVGVRVLIGHFLSSNDVASISSCWPEGSCGDTQTTKAVAKTIGYSLQTNNKDPLLKITSTRHIEHGEVELAPT